jgi:hypothetical protein
MTRRLETLKMHRPDEPGTENATHIGNVGARHPIGDPPISFIGVNRSRSLVMVGIYGFTRSQAVQLRRLLDSAIRATEPEAITV